MKNTAISAVLVSLFASAGANAGDGHAHWGYEGNVGPGHWGDLKQEYSTCKTGTRQSPIDISHSERLEASLGNIKFDYKTVTPEIFNNGHTVQVNYGDGSKIKVGEQHYDLAQFHFHTPSENTVNGKPFSMEMHLVHKNENNELAVVGVFFKEGKHNDELQKTWDKMPTKAGSREMLSGININAANLLPAKRDYAHFKGSLTTPPCSEGVNWFVMKEPIEASKDQIAQFSSVIGNNARPVQKKNNRFILTDD